MNIELVKNTAIFGTTTPEASDSLLDTLENALSPVEVRVCSEGHYFENECSTPYRIGEIVVEQDISATIEQIRREAYIGIYRKPWFRKPEIIQGLCYRDDTHLVYRRSVYPMVITRELLKQTETKKRCLRPSTEELVIITSPESRPDYDQLREIIRRDFFFGGKKEY